MTLAALALSLLSACNTPGGLFGDGKGANQTESAPPLEANVVGVHVIRGQEPWLKFGSEGDQKPDGIRLTLLLEAGGKTKGVYGDGTIKITMYRVDRDAKGQMLPQIIKEWSFTPEEALQYQVRRPTAYGWLYSFRLAWGDAQVLGRDVKFVARFTRRDNAVITSIPAYVKVPETATSGVQ